ANEERRVAKGMTHRAQPRVTYLAEGQPPALERLDERSAHAASASARDSIASATFSPDFSPSSWKPKPVQAPANQVSRRPWMPASLRCATTDSAPKTGCS